MDNTDNTPETLKDNSLRTAGYAYLLGDAALAAGKLMEKDGWGAAGAASWGIGGLAAARYGNPSAEKQLQLLEHRLGAHLKKRGIAIPNDPSLAELAKEGSVLDSIESFLYTHPSEMLNATYAIGGLTTIKGGLKGAYLDVVSGALVTAGALAGLLVSEKKPDSQNRAEGVLGKAWEWVREKPLRASGALYTANNFIMAAEAGKKALGKNWSALPRFLTVTSYLFANYMLGSSSKGQKDNQKESHAAMQQLGTAAARVLAAQPKELQEALITDISRFLATQPQAQMDSKQIANLLHDKLSQLSNAKPMSGSWMQRTGRIASPTSPSL